MRILLVCLGNICRSPTAEAAVREAAGDAGVDVEVESAGTGSWHVGDPPDPRMAAAARRVGMALDGRARRVTADDFDRFDLVVAMDRENHAELLRLAPDDHARAKIRLFREFEDGAADPDVPDPYYGGPDGFDRVVAIVRRAAAGLVAAVREGRV